MVPEYEVSDPEYEDTLSFSSIEVMRLRRLYDDDFVISLNVANILLRRTLIDTGNALNILFFSSL